MRKKKILKNSISYLLVVLTTFSFVLGSFVLVPKKAEASVTALSAALGLSSTQLEALFALGISAGCTYLTQESVGKVAEALYKNVPAVKTFIDNVQDGVTSLVFPQSLLATTYNYISLFNYDRGYVAYANYTFNDVPYTVPFTITASNASSVLTNLPYISTDIRVLGFCSASSSDSSDNSPIVRNSANDTADYDSYSIRGINSWVNAQVKKGTTPQYVWNLYVNGSTHWFKPFIIFQPYNSNSIAYYQTKLYGSGYALEILPTTTKEDFCSSTGFDLTDPVYSTSDISVTSDLTFSEDVTVPISTTLEDTDYVNVSSVPVSSSEDDDSNLVYLPTLESIDNKLGSESDSENETDGTGILGFLEDICNWLLGFFTSLGTLLGSIFSSTLSSINTAVQSIASNTVPPSPPSETPNSYNLLSFLNLLALLILACIAFVVRVISFVTSWLLIPADSSYLPSVTVATIDLMKGYTVPYFNITFWNLFLSFSSLMFVVFLIIVIRRRLKV